MHFIAPCPAREAAAFRRHGEQQMIPAGKCGYATIADPVPQSSTDGLVTMRPVPPSCDVICTLSVADRLAA